MLQKLPGPIKALILSIFAFFVLYFGFSKASPKAKNPEKSGVSAVVENDINQKALALLDSLSNSEKSQIALFMQQLEKASNDSLKSMALQKISGFWYSKGKVGLAADYAREVAKISATPDAWSLAATNYVLAVKQSDGDESSKNEWLAKAREGFQQATLLDTNNVISKLNQALLAVEFPENGPMEGILALRKLNEQYPDEPAVLYHLARLAIKTNQLDRAKERLAHLVKIAPDYKRAYCLLAEIAEKENDAKALKMYKEKCPE